MSLIEDLKQSYCRDLRDCQTYFPCAVFSSGFSYLHVIKRCSDGLIFDERKQKCVKNTFMDPICSKQKAPKRSRIRTTTTTTTMKRPIRVKEEEEEEEEEEVKRPKMKIPVHRTPAPSANFLKRKNLELPHVVKQENPMNSKFQRVCYVTNWSRFRSGEAKFEIEFIDPFMCTHIIYAYATVDSSKPEIVPIQKDDTGKNKKRFINDFRMFFFEEQYRELLLLKKRNPELKLSIRIGGKSGQFTRHLKRSKTASRLVRSLAWY